MNIRTTKSLSALSLSSTPSPIELEQIKFRGGYTPSLNSMIDTKSAPISSCYVTDEIDSIEHQSIDEKQGQDPGVSLSENEPVYDGRITEFKSTLSSTPLPGLSFSSNSSPVLDYRGRTQNDQTSQLNRKDLGIKMKFGGFRYEIHSSETERKTCCIFCCCICFK